MARYNVHTLDVWGNAEDGFDVNDVYPSQGVVEIEDDAPDADILLALFDQGFSTSSKGGEVSGQSDETTIYIDDAEDGRPVFELRRAD